MAWANFPSNFETPEKYGTKGFLGTLFSKNQLFIQKLSRIWCLKNVKFVENETLKLWILWKMRFWKCEFCEKCDFENGNFVKNEILKLWILWKMRFWKCEFCEKWDFEIVNFVKSEVFQKVNLWINWGFLLQCGKT